MAFSMHEEAVYEDELIDEFDAPDALLNPAPTFSRTLQHRQQQLPPPLVSAQSLRHQHTLAHVPPTAADPWETTRLAGALYPSFEELNGDGGSLFNGSKALSSTLSPPSPYGAEAAQPPAPPLQQQQQQQVRVQYPTVEASARQTEPGGRELSRDHEYTTTWAFRSTPESGIPVKQAPPVQPRTPHRTEVTATPEPINSPTDLSPEYQQQGEPIAPPVEEPESLPMLSQYEFDVKQKEITQELKGYEQQLDYLAHALAGDTPHQKEERKRRELERREREHQRLVAMENRVQHQIERAHDRELRRAKMLERTHRASRSSSPEMRREESREDGEEENVEPHKDI